MISYEQWCRIRSLQQNEGLRASQIAEQLGLHRDTVARYLKASSWTPRKAARRPSKLDTHKPQIHRMLERHPYSAAQILHAIREAGYTGGRSILADYVAKVRPPKAKAFLELHFEPGECAQVDWGHAGTIAVGNTRRRLSFFVMVLGHSRMIYVQFTLSQTLEHFLDCHRAAFEFFGGTPQYLMIDNLKSAVLSHPKIGPVIYNPRYLDLAAHYGFEVRACNVRAAHEKGRVERAVSYVRKSFLCGLELERFEQFAPAAAHWMEHIANCRVHGVTRERPIDRHTGAERAALRGLPAAPYDVGVQRPIRINSQHRITLDTNRYSVPAQYASTRAQLRLYPERVCIYHDGQLITEHPRNYGRHQDLLNPDHQSELLNHRRKARDNQALRRLLRNVPAAAAFVAGLQQRSLNPSLHIRKIDALTDIYGPEALRRAIADAIELHAYSSEYLATLLEQHARKLPEAGALHITRNQDLLDLELPEPDLGVYTEDPEQEPAEPSVRPPGEADREAPGESEK